MKTNLVAVYSNLEKNHLLYTQSNLQNRVIHAVSHVKHEAIIL